MTQYLLPSTMLLIGLLGLVLSRNLLKVLVSVQILIVSCGYLVFEMMDFDLQSSSFSFLFFFFLFGFVFVFVGFGLFARYLYLNRDSDLGHLKGLKE